MKLTIIPSDNAVYKNDVKKTQGLLALDLTSCDIPANVHALQWYETYGEIEFNPAQPGTLQPPNQAITELPQWALNCVTVWDAWSPPPPPPNSAQLDPDNTDYQQYLAWLAEGNTPLPAEE